MINRAAADAELLARTGAFLPLAKIGTAPGGTPPRVVAFDGPVAAALAWCGVALADPTAPADADFANLPASSWFEFLDVAEFRVLLTATAALTGQSTTRKLPDVELTRSLTGLAEAFRSRGEFVKLSYGYGLGGLTGGVIRVRARPRRAEF